jgi:hypothetical protein
MLDLGLTRFRSRRCAVCGLRVRRDDPLGLLDGRLVHAECAIVHWLIGPRAQSGPSPSRAPDPDGLDPEAFTDRVTGRADRPSPTG